MASIFRSASRSHLVKSCIQSFFFNLANYSSVNNLSLSLISSPSPLSSSDSLLTAFSSDERSSSPRVKELHQTKKISIRTRDRDKTSRIYLHVVRITFHSRKLLLKFQLVWSNHGWALSFSFITVRNEVGIFDVRDIFGFLSRRYKLQCWGLWQGYIVTHTLAQLSGCKLHGALSSRLDSLSSHLFKLLILLLKATGTILVTAEAFEAPILWGFSFLREQLIFLRLLLTFKEVHN